MSPPSPPHRVPAVWTALTWTGWLSLGVFSAVAAAVGRIEENVCAFQATYALGFFGYVLLLAALRFGPHADRAASSWRWWLAGCVLLRIALLGVAPGDDVYRYLWEGRVQWAGFNPFVHAPDDPALAALQDADRQRINHPSQAAIYPPIAQLEFLLAAIIFPSVYTLKAFHVLWDILVIIVLADCLRASGRGPHEAAVYALCPLVLTAFAVEAHVDSLMLLWIVLSMRAAMADRLVWAGGLLGLAMATKLVPVVLWPWLLVRNRRAAVFALLVFGAAYVPFVGAGAGLFRSLIQFGRGETFFDFLGTFRLDSALGIPVRELAASCVAAGLFFFALRRPACSRFGAHAFGGLLLLLPVVHYWYLTWVFVFLALRIQWRWIAAGAAMTVYFEANLQQEISGAWVMPSWAPETVWGVFAVAWLTEIAMFALRAHGPGRRAQVEPGGRSGPAAGD